MKIQMIFNPNAGRGRGAKAYPEIIKKLRDAGHEVIPHQTLYRFHAIEIVKNLNLYETDALVSVGGDGTSYEVLNGLMNNSCKKLPPIGIIPVGTGNSFSKDLNIASWEDGIKAINEENHRPVDILSYKTEGNEYFFVNNLGFGFVADVSISSEPIKRIGMTAYALGVLYEIAKLKSMHVELEIDGNKYEHEVNFIYFCNSVWAGGNMKISPNSKFDDGLVEILVMKSATRKELLKLFPRVFSGTHMDHPKVKVYQGKHIKVTSDPVKYCNPDGEIFGVTPLEVKILPNIARYFSL
ncbi:MAG: diacylglycerol kinase family lipid kinase [Candidatus Marinimicrobia bacterium]|nr:diacylglycerol kinase family lipid kinase [Candidatus Neomarinimicrobiota bacterium]